MRIKWSSLKKLFLAGQISAFVLWSTRFFLTLLQRENIIISDLVSKKVLLNVLAVSHFQL